MANRSPASVLAALAYFRDEQQRLYPRSLHARYYHIAAEAIERVGELEAEREKWKRQGAAEELRRLAAEWSKRGRDRRMLAQELVDLADEIKARREATNAAD